MARARSTARRPVVAGVAISHPDRLLFPSAGLTKLDVAGYYAAISDWIVPHLEDRPLTLVRCPEGAVGTCFYMKHAKVWAPEPLRRVRIREKTKVGEYLIADSAAAAVGLVQMGILEVHTWNSRFARIEHPDRVVIDLDPGARVTWPRVIAAARVVRELLETLGLDSFVKTTGGRGLHVVVPLTPRDDWSQCLAFARAAADDWCGMALASSPHVSAKLAGRTPSSSTTCATTGRTRRSPRTQRGPGLTRRCQSRSTGANSRRREVRTASRHAQYRIASHACGAIRGRSTGRRSKRFRDRRSQRWNGCRLKRCARLRWRSRLSASR